MTARGLTLALREHGLQAQPNAAVPIVRGPAVQELVVELRLGAAGEASVEPSGITLSGENPQVPETR
jgi:hypothetical protein